MISAVCEHENRQRYGKTKAGTPRYRCRDCGKTFTASTDQLGGMRIGMEKAVQIIEMLCEGMSVSATARLTHTDPHTVIDLMTYVGERCETSLAEEIKDVCVDDIQVDEIWQFVFCKAKTAERKHYVGGCGDTYCFTAIERGTKLLVTWHFGRRNQAATEAFCRKLNNATAGHFFLSSDGWSCYPMAVWQTVGDRVDYGQLVKIYRDGDPEDQRRYSPAKIIEAKRTPIIGVPDREHICTSHVERMNGSIRTFVKRMGRLTYCFSKRWDNHRAALGLFFAHYNWCRKHRSLNGKTPAEAHGLTNHRWTVRELMDCVLEA